MTVYQLICEGACNPQLRDVDAAKALHSTLVHTPHTVDGTWASCAICGTTRRYGGNGSLRPWRTV